MSSPPPALLASGAGAGVDGADVGALPLAHAEANVTTATNAHVNFDTAADCRKSDSRSQFSRRYIDCSEAPG